MAKKKPRHVYAKQLRTALAAENCWAIHPPKLVEMHALSRDALLSTPDAEVKSSFGVRTDDQSRILRVGAVAVIPITGVIQPTTNIIVRYFGGTSLELLERDFKAALADSQVKAIVLFVDSPGGSASQNDEVSQVIYNARGRGKQILSFVRGMCCSAGYYLGSSADRIIASSSSYIGSIGSIYVHQEESGWMEKIGLRATVITHGSKKGYGNPYEKLSPDARASLQHMVSAYGSQFETAVARNRGITLEAVRERYGQGDAFIAAEALSRGLIDQIGTWEDVLNSLNAGPAPLPTQPDRENKSESALAAGASAVPNDSPPVQPAGQEVVTVDKKVKAMLFAMGLIASMDASDEVCNAALNAFFAARNESLPATPEATVTALKGTPASNGATASGSAPPSQPAPAQPTQQTTAATQAVVANDAAAIERQRIVDLQAAGAKLGIDSATIAAAVNNGTGYEAAVKQWMASNVTTHTPVAESVRVVGEGAQCFVEDAANALVLRMENALPASERRISLAAKDRTPQVERMSGAPLLYFAKQCLRNAGIRVDDDAHPNDIAEAALGMGNREKCNLLSSGIQMAGPVLRPGDFPNILSGLANKLFDGVIERSEATWDLWCGRFMEDLPDFKPAPIMGQGEANQLDQVPDSQEFREIAIAEELLSMIQLDRFGNKVGFSPVLLQNNDLGTFTERMINLGDAWEMTINRLALNLLLGNVAMLDGIALFHASHNNIITPTGGAPSAAQWEAMNNIYAAQTTIGATGYVRGELKVALVAPQRAVAADQTFMSLAAAGETKQAVTDATVNTYRRKNVIVAVEPELQRVGTAPWWGFADPAKRPVIKVGFMLGWGRKGRREAWYDPNTKTRYFSLEGRTGAAATHYRNGVYNPGQ